MHDDPMDDQTMLGLDAIAAVFARIGLAHAVDPAGDQVLVTLADGSAIGGNGGRELAVRVHDAGPGASGSSPLLTFSAAYDLDVPAHLSDDVRTATAILTRFLVVGHFELDDDDPALHLRYSMLVERRPSEALMLQLVSLLDYQHLHFGDYLEAVCSGAAPIAIFEDLVQRGEASGLD